MSELRKPFLKRNQIKKFEKKRENNAKMQQVNEKPLVRNGNFVQTKKIKIKIKLPH